MAVPVLALVNYDVCLFQNGGYSQSVYLFLVSYFWREFKGLRSFWQHHVPPTVWLNDPLISINGPKKSWHDGSAGQNRSALAPTLFHRFQADDAIQAFQGSRCGFVGVFALVDKVLVAQRLCHLKRNECRNGCIGVNHSMENPYIHTSNHIIILLWIIFIYLIILPYSLWIWISDSST